VEGGLLCCSEQEKKHGDAAPDEAPQSKAAKHSGLSLLICVVWVFGFPGEVKSSSNQSFLVCVELPCCIYKCVQSLFLAYVPL
jgi:hypothetical protein